MSDQPGSTDASSANRQPGSLPHPDRKAGANMIPQIEHIVALVMENHSYDNKLGMLRRQGADGFTLGADGKPTATNPYQDGKLQHAFQMPNTCQVWIEPRQSWDDCHAQFADGSNTGFVTSRSGPVAMGYWGAADQPFYYSLAHHFPIADRYFCSVLAPTFPNRRYLISATSLGMIDDTLPALFGYPPNGTIFDRLEEAGLTWKDYCSTLGVVVSSAELYPELYVKNVGTRVVGIDSFFEDVSSGQLPNFSLVEPNYLLGSEETPQNIAVGEHFAARVINAVMSGPAWERTLLIWTYDEHGGYFDHVPPPAALAPDDIPPDTRTGEPRYNGFRQYGFRVPCAVVSPWARPGYVSHQVFDHTSICALVENKWNLPAMTRRDANANPMLDMLDFSQPAFLHPPTLAEPLLSADPLKTLECDITGPGTIPPPGSISPAPK